MWHCTPILLLSQLQSFIKKLKNTFESAVECRFIIIEILWCSSKWSSVLSHPPSLYLSENTSTIVQLCDMPLQCCHKNSVSFSIYVLLFSIGHCYSMMIAHGFQTRHDLHCMINSKLEIGFIPRKIYISIWQIIYWQSSVFYLENSMQSPKRFSLVQTLASLTT